MSIATDAKVRELTGRIFDLEKRFAEIEGVMLENLVKRAREILLKRSGHKERQAETADI